MWVDYNITQMGENFRVEGDWPGEVMGLMQDGTKKESVLSCSDLSLKEWANVKRL